MPWRRRPRFWPRDSRMQNREFEQRRGVVATGLKARKIDASEKRLISEAVGEIELEDGVLVIRRIHVRMHLKAPAEQRETAERAHRIFADRCPVYRSLKAAIAMTTELVFEAI